MNVINIEKRFDIMEFDQITYVSIVHQNQDFWFEQIPFFSLLLLVVSKKKINLLFTPEHWRAKASFITFGEIVFKSSSRNESRILSCSADRINAVGVVVDVIDVGGTSVDGDQTFPDSIFSNVGTIRLDK